jgi:membrane protein DedA with SNARE-associated domain
MIDLFGEIWVRWGYLGFFIVALISNAIPHSTIPYLVIIAPMLGRFSGLPLLLAILSLGAGATLGKIVVYLVGRGMARVRFIKSYTYEASRFFRRHKTSIFILVFIVAALPIPDDVFYIPIGMSKYSFIEFSFALLAGKLIIALLAAIYGRTLYFILEELTALPAYIQTPISILVTALLVLVIGRIDWKEVENAYIERGVITAIICLTKSFIKSLVGLISRFITLLLKISTRR